MKAFRWRSRRFLLGTATSAAALALIAVGVPAAALASHPASHAADQQGPGYPPPKGIYKPFTNCPIATENALMQESTGSDAVGCVAGQISGGSVTLGNITTPVSQPVDVQFGIWDPINAAPGGDWTAGGQFIGGILPPPSGLSAMVRTKPDLIPDSLTSVLGCATATDPTVQHICTQAQNLGGRFNRVFALAQNVGQLTNFAVFSWTQRIDFKLINPLLGNNCTVGSANNPIVLNPQVALGPGGTFTETPDPNPAKHPNVDVLALNGAVASDSTFFAPGVTGCGPGGANNIPVDQALDAGAGLPAASGTNSFTFNGSLFLADSFSSTNQARILLSAFRDSVRQGGSAEHPAAVAHSLTKAGLRKELRRYGFR